MPTPSVLAAYLSAPIFSRGDVLKRPTPVPAQSGVYGWWFRVVPAAIDTSGCVNRDGLKLLYTGISPSRPPANGKPPSRQNLRKRIKIHYRGNASASTLRRTLGCLLVEQLGIELRRHGSGNRLHFGSGESALDEWMAANALVSWIVHPEPWIVEEQLIGYLDLPLNLRGNDRNPFHPRLTAVRELAMRRAEELPVLV